MKVINRFISMAIPNNEVLYIYEKEMHLQDTISYKSYPIVFLI